MGHPGSGPQPPRRPAPTPEVEAGERETCPVDGQSLAFHRVTEIGPNGLPRTNGEFMGCDFGAEPDHPFAPSQSPQGSELGDGAVELDALMDVVWPTPPGDLTFAKAQVICRAVLASDWLAQREAAAVKAALLSAADEWPGWWKFPIWLRDRANRSEGGRA